MSDTNPAVHAATEVGLKLEILDLASRGIVLSV